MFIYHIISKRLKQLP